MSGSFVQVRRIVLVFLLAGLVVVPVGCARSSRSAAVVRVDQVGYMIGEVKTAQLLSTRDEAGARAIVVDQNGTEVLTVVVGPDRGQWNAQFKHVNPIDVSALTQVGTYLIKVKGRSAATSPPFRIGTAASLFGPLAQNAVRYFQTHRDGADQVAGPGQRPAAHLSDREATVYETPDNTLTEPLSSTGNTVDVAGGWYDAGDYLKFTHTTAYALILLLLVQRDGPQLPGLAAETAHGLAWLDKIWDSSRETLYAQVGIGSGVGGVLGDHDTWRLPEADDRLAVTPGDSRYYQRYRPVFRAAAPGRLLSPNLAGRVAAAFALAAQVQAATAPAQAAAQLNKAAQIFALANTEPGTELVTTEPHSFYPETSWHDDLAVAATELSLAATALHDARAADWAHQATHWAKANTADASTDALSVYDLSAVADAELAHVLTAGAPTDAEIDVDGLRADLRQRLEAGARAAADDPMGAAAGTGGSDYAARELGYAATAELYHEISGDSRYGPFGTVQRGVVLGANGWGTSMVLGAGTVSPHCPHDQIANLSPAGSLALGGGVINGPNLANRVLELSSTAGPSDCSAGAFAPYDRDDSRYADSVVLSATTEPAIDFTATGLYAFARIGGPMPLR